MTPAAAASVVELLDHVDRLKAIHRSGGSPSFGQVEALFDQAAIVRTTLTAADDPTRPVAWPTPPRAIEQAARHLVALVTASLAAPESGR